MSHHYIPEYGRGPQDYEVLSEIVSHFLDDLAQALTRNVRPASSVQDFLLDLDAIHGRSHRELPLHPAELRLGLAAFHEELSVQVSMYSES